MNVDKLIFSKLDESYKDFVKFDNNNPNQKQYCLYYLRWFL